jgi:hypothetical protein
MYGKDMPITFTKSKTSMKIKENFLQDIMEQLIAVQLSDGTEIYAEVRQLGESKVSDRNFQFDQALAVVQSITKDVAGAIKSAQQQAQPDKISVKLGLEIAVESGQLTALFVKGAGKANLEITMEWGK